MTFTCIKRKSP